MRYVLSLFFGLLAGAAAAGALLYFNPLTQWQDTAAQSPDWSLSYSLNADSIWISSHDQRVDLPLQPRNVSTLSERGIKGTIVTAMPMRDAGGNNAAAASRISVPSSGTEFIRAGVLVEDYWLISVPGQGSVFVYSVNNQWPLLRDTVVRVDWLQREWQGPDQYAPTKGPDQAGARVVGLNGSFAGASGHAAERLSLDVYEGDLAQLSGELLLDVSGMPLQNGG
jgi:hypothetical protein